jgi:hypothetical protein
MYISLIIMPSCEKIKDYRNYHFVMINIIHPNVDSYLERTKEFDIQAV